MYLLDNCSFIWTVQNSSKTSPKLIEILQSYEEVFLSQVSLWEIAIKQTTGKLELELDTFELENLCKREEISIIPLYTRHFERIKKLPLIHRDPFDRIIIATAIEENLTLLTSDKNILKYPEVKTLW